MTSVNSPACLLARNHFYRHMSAGPEPVTAVGPARHRHSHITVWVTIATTGFPGVMGTKGLWASAVLGSSSSPVRLAASKQPGPTHWGVKHKETNAPHWRTDRKDARTSGSN